MSVTVYYDVVYTVYRNNCMFGKTIVDIVTYLFTLWRYVSNRVGGDRLKLGCSFGYQLQYY